MAERFARVCRCLYLARFPLKGRLDLGVRLQMAGFRAIHRVRCEQIWLGDGWAQDQLIEITPEGLIADIGPVDETSVDLVLTGPVIPGVPNLHSHCLLYTSPSPRDLSTSRMPSSA